MLWCVPEIGNGDAGASGAGASEGGVGAGECVQAQRHAHGKAPPQGRKRGNGITTAAQLAAACHISVWGWQAVGLRASSAGIQREAMEMQGGSNRGKRSAGRQCFPRNRCARHVVGRVDHPFIITAPA